MTMIPATCDICGEPFNAKVHNQGQVNRTCSQECREALKRKNYSSPYGVQLTTGTMGAVGEMVVAIDLINRGYHVFRALSPSCPCDLVAYRDGVAPFRVEVRTATRKADGSIPMLATRYQSDIGKQDVFAVVTRDGDIVYVPGLPGG